MANLNNDQRLDGSGSAAEGFLQRTTRVPGLAHLPTAPRDVELLRAARASSRDSQVKCTQSQRKPEVFHRGQHVLVQNNLTKLWNIKARVLARRSHQGIETNSYIVKAQKTGRQLVSVGDYWLYCSIDGQYTTCLLPSSWPSHSVSRTPHLSIVPCLQ